MYIPNYQPFDNLEDSYKKIAADHKFYLSFENQLCKDYITEKFFLALKVDMIPIVNGGFSKRDYENIAPPHSFIHVDDFSSAQEIMNYLETLSEDSDAYNSYFWWKQYYQIASDVLTQSHFYSDNDNLQIFI